MSQVMQGAVLEAPGEAEVALLWAAASVPVDPLAVADQAKTARLPLVIQAATHHRVGPLVLSAFQQAGVELGPEELKAARNAIGWQARSMLALPAAAAAALAPLEEANLRPMALKGLAIAGRYPAPDLRPMDDIDLLLPGRMYKRAAVVLEQAGWRRIQHRGQDDAGYDVVLVNPQAPGVPLELHRQSARWRERPPGLESRHLWSARVSATVYGHPVWTLPPSVELVFLLAHAAKTFHAFDRLLFSVDLTVASAAPGLDWGDVARLLSTCRRTVAGAVGLRLARRLGAEVPDELTALPRRLESSGIVRSLLDPARPFYPKRRSLETRYILLDGLRPKLRLATGELLRPPPTKSRWRAAGQIARLSSRRVLGRLLGC